MNQLQSTAINGISGWFKWSRVCCTARPVAWLDDERVTAAADDTNHRLNHFLSTHLFSKQSRSINYSHHQSIQQSLNQLLFTNNSSSSSNNNSKINLEKGGEGGGGQQKSNSSIHLHRLWLNESIAISRWSI